MRYLFVPLCYLNSLCVGPVNAPRVRSTYSGLITNLSDSTNMDWQLNCGTISVNRTQQFTISATPRVVCAPHGVRSVWQGARALKGSVKNKRPDTRGPRFRIYRIYGIPGFGSSETVTEGGGGPKFRLKKSLFSRITNVPSILTPLIFIPCISAYLQYAMKYKT